MAMPLQEPDHSRAIALPPLIFLAAFVIGMAADQVQPLPIMPFGLQYGLAAVFAAVAFCLVVWAAPAFQRHDTSVHVHRPTTCLITTGAYARSRNPLYVALSMLYIALAVAYDSVWAVAMAPVAIAVLHWGVVLREERYLDRKFGDAYRQYCRSVRRWL